MMKKTLAKIVASAALMGSAVAGEYVPIGPATETMRESASNVSEGARAQAGHADTHVLTVSDFGGTGLDFSAGNYVLNAIGASDGELYGAAVVPTSGRTSVNVYAGGASLTGAQTWDVNEPLHFYLVDTQTGDAYAVEHTAAGASSSVPQVVSLTNWANPDPTGSNDDYQSFVSSVGSKVFTELDHSVDTDGDGYSDDFENHYGLNPNVHFNYDAKNVNAVFAKSVKPNSLENKTELSFSGVGKQGQTINMMYSTDLENWETVSSRTFDYSAPFDFSVDRSYSDKGFVNFTFGGNN